MLAMDPLCLTLCLFVSVYQGSEWPRAHTRLVSRKTSLRSYRLKHNSIVLGPNALTKKSSL